MQTQPKQPKPPKPQPKPPLSAKIEKLVFGGQGLAHVQASNSQPTKTAFIWNALPGEEVEFTTTKNKKGIIEGVATKILKPSPHRIPALEPHFLSCSPLQILTYDEENEQKLEMSKEAFSHIGNLKKTAPRILETLEIESPKQEFGYRNKMEYSFYEDLEQKSTSFPRMSLAFFERSQHRKSAIEPCILATKEINEVALRILEFVRKNNLTHLDVKATIIRSNEKGQVIAGLFLKTEKPLAHIPKTDKQLIGFHIYLSDFRSPASIITSTIHTEGETHLTNTLKQTKLKYGLNSFFQINQEIFLKALDEIENYLESPTTGPLEVIDFYSGVGAIGLPLAKKCKTLTLVDSNEEAIEYAEHNIKANKIKNAQAIASPAEKMIDLITPNKTIILDPPRAGLHEDVIKKLIKETPPKIIYLSCNVSTQARDIALLGQKYTIKHMKLFNFFPRTPHIESLCVMERS